MLVIVSLLYFYEYTLLSYFFPLYMCVVFVVCVHVVYVHRHVHCTHKLWRPEDTGVFLDHSPDLLLWDRTSHWTEHPLDWLTSDLVILPSPSSWVLTSDRSCLASYTGSRDWAEVLTLIHWHLRMFTACLGIFLVSCAFTYVLTALMQIRILLESPSHSARLRDHCGWVEERM